MTTTDRSEQSATSERAGGAPNNIRRKSVLRSFSWHCVRVSAVTLGAIAVFFTIVGLFGFAASIAALSAFIALAVLISRLPQIEETTL